LLDAPGFQRDFGRAQQGLAHITVVVGTSRRLHMGGAYKVIQKFHVMLSLTTMLALTTFPGMKLTQNAILVTGFRRGRPEAVHALGLKVIIAGRRQEVLDQTTDADPGIASVTLDERGSACVSL
jgi:hypothetical protein